MTQGDLGFVESYMEGDWESPDLADVVELALLNAETWNLSRRQGFLYRLFNRLAHLMRDNSKRGCATSYGNNIGENRVTKLHGVMSCIV